MLLAATIAVLVLSWDAFRSIRWRLPRESVDEAKLLGSIAAELRAGSSLRASVAAASARRAHPMLRDIHRLAIAGAPLSELGELVVGLPINGRRVGVALRVAEITGGRLAAVFGRLADRAIDAAALDRERRSITTQVRMSAAVVVSLPMLALLFGGAARIWDLAATGSGGLLVAVAGLGMQTAGGALVWWMARS